MSRRDPTDNRHVIIGVTIVSLGLGAVFLWQAVRAGRPVRAVIAGDLAGLEAILASDKGITTKEYRIGKVQYHTLVQLAAANQNAEAITLLIRHGANVNQKGRFSDSALHLAVQYSCIECVQLLIKHGAALNEKGFSGQTPIFWAIKQSKILQVLLDAGADCNVRDDFNRTPLEFAAQFGETNAVQIISNKCAAAAALQ